MEELKAVAVEEIALEGRRGCSLSQLWQLLEARLPLDGVPQLLPVLKQHLWQQLRADPTLILSTEELQAEAKAAAERAPAKKQARRKKKADEDDDEERTGSMLEGRPTSSLPLDSVPEDLAEAEAAHIVLVAPEHAWLSVVGVFDELYAIQQLSTPQLSTLEMVAQSRHNGAVSSDMANALAIQHRNFFYVLKMLEARGLIVRSKLMLPDGKGNSGWTTTQLIHLPRYAPRLAIGSEAIIREVKTSDAGGGAAGSSGGAQEGGEGSGGAARKRGSGAGGSGNKLVVRDDAATLKEICDFLAQQGAGKYVSESQVKTVLGFTGSTAAHRQWRRLRLRLVKLGCISLETGLLGNKALSVIKLLKPYKLKVPVVVDSDEDELQAELDEAADAEEDGGAGGADADAPVAAAGEGDGAEGGDAAAAAAAAGGDGAGAGSSSRANGVPVEVGRDQMLLELICEAGPDGVLTPHLTKRMGISPKLFLKGLPEMCKKYGVKAEYDMTKKTLTNRITAPQHLLEAYTRQKNALNPGSTITPAPSAQTAGATAVGSTGGAAAAAAAAAAGLPPLPPRAGTPTAAGPQQQQQQQQQQAAGSRQGTADLSGLSDAADGTAAAAGSDMMDIDSLVDAAVAAEVAKQQQQQEPEVPADAAAAAAAASAAAAAGIQGASVTRGINHGGGTWGGAVPVGTAASGGPGRRTVMGVSRHQLRRLEALRQKLAEQGFMLQQEVRSVLVHAGDKAQPDKSQLPKGPDGPDTKTCSRLVQHLLDEGEVELTRLQYNQELVATTREVDVILPKGTELTPELLQRIATYNSALGRALRQRSMKRREVMLQSAKVLGVADTDGADRTTLELNQPRAIVNVTDKQQAELSAAAAAAAPAPALHDPQPTDPAAAPPAAAEPQPPAGAAAPTMHQLQLLMPGPTIRRRLRGFRSLAVIPKPGAASRAPAAAAAAAAGAAGGPPGNKPPTKEGRKRTAPNNSSAAHFPASERRAPMTSLGQSLVASLGQKDKKEGQDLHKGAAIMRMHHNGYIPSIMLRAKLLHQYLAGLAGLQVDLHDDINPPAPAQPPAAPAAGTAAAAGAAAAAAGGSDGGPPDSSGNGGNSSNAAGAAAAAAFASNQRQLRLIFDKDDTDVSEGGEVEVPPQPQAVKERKEAQAAAMTQLVPGVPAAVAAAAAAAAGADSAAGAEEAVGAQQQQAQQQQQLAQQQQWSKLEQQLGGRLLSVHELWHDMPLALALQVAGATRNVSNLLQLICQTDPPPRIRDFDREQIAAVFEARSWGRLVAALSVLARLKLLTPARRKRLDSEPEPCDKRSKAELQQDAPLEPQDGEQQQGQGDDDPSKDWVQAHAQVATHLVIGTTGVMDLTPFAPAADTTDNNADGDKADGDAAQPAAAAAGDGNSAAAASAGGGAGSDGVKRVSYNFRQAGQWRQYWITLQRVFDSPLMTQQLVATTFPANAVPDVARHRSWVWYRGLTMRPWLRLLERIHDLPIEQLDQHMARTLADELGVPYQPVLIVITRWRTEANEERERQGLSRVYLLEHKAAEAEARAAQAATAGTAGLTATELKRMRAAEHRQRRLKRSQQREASRRRKREGLPTPARSRKQPTDPAAEAAAAAGEAAAALPDGSDSEGPEEGAPAVANATGVTGSKPRWRSRTDAGSGSAGSGGSSESEDHEARCRAAGMPQIAFRLSAPSASEPMQPQPLAGRRRVGKNEDGAGEGDAAPAAAVSLTATGEERQRHRWTPDEDKQLLRWVLANRVELGTRDTIRWRSSASADLPLGQEACARRLAFFKRKPQIKAFIDNLQAQAIQIHREFSRRRHALRQQLQRLQQQRRLSVNPLLLREAAAGKQRLVPQVTILQPAAPEDLPLRPLEPPPLLEQPPGTSAAAAGADQDTAVASEAAQVLASAGPYVLNPNGSILLLPDASIQQRLNRLSALIDAFAAPRQVGGKPGPRGITDGMGPARAHSGRRARGEGGERGRRKRRRLGQQGHEGADGADDDLLNEEGSTGEDEEEGADELDEWSSGGSEDEFQLLRAAKQHRQQQQRRLAGKGGRSSRRSRQVAPLKTVADEVAAMAAMQEEAAAAAAAALAQRRAAGEVIGQQEEEAELRQQLLLLKKAGTKRRRRRKQQQAGGAGVISDPKDLIQSWRKHQTVETRPSAAGAAGGAQQQQQPKDGEAAAAGAAGAATRPTAAAEGQVVAAPRPWRYGVCPTLPVVHAMHLVVSLLQLVEVGGSLPADASTALLVRFSQAEVAAAFRWLSALGWLNAGAAKRGFQLSRSWHRALRPPDRTLGDLMDRTPAAALALAQAGLLSLPPDAAAAAEPVAAAAEPAAAAVAAGGGEMVPAEAGVTDAGAGAAAPAAAPAAAAVAGQGVGGAGEGGRTLALLEAFDLEQQVIRQQQEQQQKQKQPAKVPQQQQQQLGAGEEAAKPAAEAEPAAAAAAAAALAGGGSMEVDATATSDGAASTAAAAAAAEAAAEPTGDAPAAAPKPDVMAVDAAGQPSSAAAESAEPVPAADATAPAAPAAAAAAGAGGAASKSSKAASSSKAAGSSSGTTNSGNRVARARRQLEVCTAALHSRLEQPGSYWVGVRPPTPAAAAAGEGSVSAPAPPAAAVPGALLLQLLAGAATGQLQLELCALQQGPGGVVSRVGLTGARGGRQGGRAGAGSMLALLRKAPLLLVSASRKQGPAATAAVTEITAEGEEGGQVPAAAAAAASREQQQQMVYVPAVQGDSSRSSKGRSSSGMFLLAYAGSGPTAAAAAAEQARTPTTTDSAAADGDHDAPVNTPSSPSAKRKRSRASTTDTAASMQQQQWEDPLADAATGAAPAAAAAAAAFSPLCVGADEVCRQRAEDACLAAAAAAPVGEDEAATVVPEPPQKRQRTQSAAAASADGDAGLLGSSRGAPGVDVLRWLLATIRAAGAAGMSEQQLLALESPATTAAADAGKLGEQHTAAAEGGDAAAVNPAAAAAATAAASAVTTAAAAAGAPGGLSGAVSSGVCALWRYRLVRRVPGWHSPGVWVSSESSNRLMAWPVPANQDQRAGTSTASAAAAGESGGKAGGGGFATAAAAAEGAAAEADAAAGMEVPAADTSAATSTAAAAAADVESDGVLLVPWLDHRGGLNRVMWQGLVKRLVGVVLRNPGIPEPLLLAQMDAVAPAAAEELLRVLVTQRHLMVKEVPAAAGSSTSSRGGGLDGGFAPAAGAEADAGSVNRPALKLGLALGKCSNAAGLAQPPSLLMGGRRTAAAAAAAVGSGVKSESVRHYWPSLFSSSVCHLTALPPCRTAAAALV